MKKIILLLLSVFVLTSCHEDDSTFSPGITKEAFSFRPIAGGAVMHFHLPDDENIIGLHVRYKDAYGKNILRSASHLSDSLLLVGFNEAKENVEAQVMLLNRYNEESAPIDVTFKTADSGPVAFIKTADVVSNWNGFTVKYTTPKNTEGLVHVFYLGTNPKTGEPDTVLVNSFALAETENLATKSFVIKQDVKKPIVVLRVEDFRGHIVAEKCYTDVECLETQLLNPDNLSFYCEKTITNPVSMMGSEYLFDGDTKGLTPWLHPELARKFNMFVAGPNAAGVGAAPMYIDMKKNMITGSVRLYNHLYNSLSPTWYQVGGSWYQTYLLPCDVDLYGAKDDGQTGDLSGRDMDQLNWVKLSNFRQDPDLTNSSRWCPTTFQPGAPGGQYSSLEEMQAADPEFMELLIPADGQADGYRYLKLVINNTFNLSQYADMYHNTNHYVIIQEMEVYVKK